MIFLRSLLFAVCFFGWNSLVCILLLPVLLLPRWYLVKFNILYIKVIAWLERHILKIYYEISGQENLPAEPCIIALKHQSAWETLKLHLWFKDPVIVLKQELTWIPLWGWFARKLGCIAVDRAGGIKAMNKMVRAGKVFLARHRPITVFPQGTRVKPGHQAPYRIGVGKLYQALNVPVVPVALNSGRFWSKNSFFKYPGTVQVKILPAIQPGLSVPDFMKRLESELEAASEALL